jgi:hypothetical protein
VLSDRLSEAPKEKPAALLELHLPDRDLIGAARDVDFHGGRDEPVETSAGLVELPASQAYAG